VALADDPRYLGYRKAVIDFLYTRQAHVEKAGMKPCGLNLHAVKFCSVLN
jgi:hypothetical protein